MPGAEGGAWPGPGHLHLNPWLLSLWLCPEPSTVGGLGSGGTKEGPAAVTELPTKQTSQLSPPASWLLRLCGVALIPYPTSGLLLSYSQGSLAIFGALLSPQSSFPEPAAVPHPHSPVPSAEFEAVSGVSGNCLSPGSIRIHERVRASAADTWRAKSRERGRAWRGLPHLPLASLLGCPLAH